MAQEEKRNKVSDSSEQQVRREKLRTLQEAGQNPFAITRYDADAFSADIQNNFEAMEGKTVSLAGRLMA